MERESDFAPLQVFVNTSNVKVYINDKFQGIARSNKPLIYYTPIPQELKVHVKKKGYESDPRYMMVPVKSRQGAKINFILYNQENKLIKNWVEKSRNLTSMLREKKRKFSVIEETDNQYTKVTHEIIAILEQMKMHYEQYPGEKFVIQQRMINLNKILKIWRSYL